MYQSLDHDLTFNTHRQKGGGLLNPQWNEISVLALNTNRPFIWNH
jgi:hypothetical protein